MNYVCYSDGGYNNTLKKNGYGSFEIVNSHGEKELVRFQLSYVHSSNEAELETLFYLLCEIESFPQEDTFDVFMDSKLTFMTVTKKWRANKENIIKYSSKIIDKLAKLGNRVKLYWVPRVLIYKELKH